MELLDVAVYTLSTFYALSLVLYGVAYWMTSSRLKREHPEVWESLGRPRPFVPARDKQTKAAAYDFFWKRGFAKVNDQTLQAYARRAHASGVAYVILLAVIAALFLYKHLFLK